MLSSERYYEQTPFTRKRANLNTGKCDKLQPCGSCDRAGVPCIYTDRTKERKYNADHVERLEKRIRQAEARNKSLADELSRARANPDAVPSTLTGDQQPLRAHAKTPDAVSEISYLAINAAGERQPYLGSTSGVLFAELICSSVKLGVYADSTPTASLPGGSGPSGTVPTAQLATVVRRADDLPSQALAQELLSAYLNHENIIYPSIYPHFLSNTLKQVYEEEDYYVSRASPSEVFILNMVFAIASVHVAKYDRQLLPSAESHQARAFAEMNQVLSHGGVESLQCLLLICIWRTTSSIRDNSASMWHTVGIAVRTALELGLHRESSYSIKPGPELDEAQLVRYRDQELGRRCFWCMIAFDTITSSILGRPLGIRGDDIDTALPLVEIDGLLTPLFTSTVAGMRRIAIFNKIVRYRLFCGKLITSLHRKRSPDISIEDALRLRDELADELDLWYSSLHELRLPHNATLDEDGHSCYLSPTWYEMLYANATLMVWRPCPLLADITNDRHTLQRIYDSATNAINSYAVLHRNRLINYSWVTLHFVFMAGLSYIYAVSRHLRGRINGTQGNACLLEDDPTTIDVVNISRACSNVLVAVAERWNTQRHCHEVFDRLSDAVLNDAIKLQTASVLAQQHDSPSMSLATSANSPVSVPSASTPLQYQQVQHIQHIQQTQEVPRADYINHWNLQMQQQQQNQQQHQQSRHAQPLLPHIHQPALSLPPQQLPQTAAVGHAQLAVDTEFLHSYSDIQTLYHHQRVDNSVMHLTQDWLGYIGAAEPAGGYMTNAHLQPQQHRRPFIPSQQAPYQPPSTRM